MDRGVWSDPRIVGLSKKFVCVSLEVNRHGSPRDGQLLTFGSHGQYRITGYPAVVIMDPWREVLVLTEGYRQVGELLGILREIPADYNQVRPWRESLEKERNDSRAL